MIINVLEDVKNGLLMRSEQILTQDHLVEQRVQPLLLVDLGHRGHLLTILRRPELLRQHLLLHDFVHFHCVVGESALCSHVLLFDLGTELLGVTLILVDFALLVLYILIMTHPYRLIIHGVHILVDARPVCAAVRGLQRRQLRPHDLHRRRLLHLHLRRPVVLAERVHQRRVVHVCLRLLERRLQGGRVGRVRADAVRLFFEGHRAVDEVNALHVLLLEGLIEHLKLDFSTLTTIVLLVPELHEFIHAF